MLFAIIRYQFLPVCLVLLSACLPDREQAGSLATYVDETSCSSCHAQEAAEWQGSHHDLAMQEANDKTVLGDFSDQVFVHFGDTSRFYRKGSQYIVNTIGPQGISGDYQVLYTFGVDPLQQYLVRLPGGRLQALHTAWDVKEKRWFHLYPDEKPDPDDALHWSGSYHTWNSMCAECHSTNLQANYDFTTDSYQTTWDQIDVGCQACHGPASEHLQWAKTQESNQKADGYRDTGLLDVNSTAERQIQSCAPCHSRRRPLTVDDDPEIGYYGNFAPELLREGLYHPDGQIQDEVYVYGSFLQSKMYRQGVRCSDCHNPHSGQLKAEGNDLCRTCHSPQPNPRFASLLARNYDSPEHHFHETGSAGAQCVNCHMVERTYMVIDPRRDHSFHIPRPDLSVKLGTPNACNDCHSDKPAEWAANFTKKWYGRKAHERPHFAAAFVLGRNADPRGEKALTMVFADTINAAIVRSTALELLRNYPGENLVRSTTAASQSAEPLLRITAANVLQSLPPGQQRALAKTLFLDSLSSVKAEAAGTLAGLPREMLSGVDLKDYRSSLAQYKRVLQAISDQAGANFTLGLLYERMARNDSAVFFYQRALSKDALFLPAYVNLANLFNRSRQNNRSKEVLLQGIRKFPEEGQLFYSLGLLMAEQKDLATAAEYLAKAAALLPENARVHYNAGLAFQHTGQADKAERLFLSACKLNPNEPDFGVALCILYMQYTQIDKAQSLADHLVKQFPQDPRAQRLFSQVSQVMEHGLNGRD